MAQIHFEEIAQNFANVQQGDKRLTRDHLNQPVLITRQSYGGDENHSNQTNLLE